VPPPIQRMRSEDLLASVFPDQVACAENPHGRDLHSDHPLVKETIDNCLHEAMDLDGLKNILDRLRVRDRIRKVAIDNAEPSPFRMRFSTPIRTRTLTMRPGENAAPRGSVRRTLRTDFAGGAGFWMRAAISQVAEESWPDVRDADEFCTMRC